MKMDFERVSHLACTAFDFVREQSKKSASEFSKTASWLFNSLKHLAGFREKSVTNTFSFSDEHTPHAFDTRSVEKVSSTTSPGVSRVPANLSADQRVFEISDGLKNALRDGISNRQGLIVSGKEQCNELDQLVKHLKETKAGFDLGGGLRIDSIDDSKEHQDFGKECLTWTLKASLPGTLESPIEFAVTVVPHPTSMDEEVVHLHLARSASLGQDMNESILPGVHSPYGLELEALMIESIRNIKFPSEPPISRTQSAPDLRSVEKVSPTTSRRAISVPANLSADQGAFEISDGLEKALRDGISNGQGLIVSGKEQRAELDPLANHLKTVDSFDLGDGLCICSIEDSEAHAEDGQGCSTRSLWASVSDGRIQETLEVAVTEAAEDAAERADVVEFHLARSASLDRGLDEQLLPGVHSPSRDKLESLMKETIRQIRSPSEPPISRTQSVPDLRSVGDVSPIASPQSSPVPANMPVASVPSGSGSSSPSLTLVDKQPATVVGNRAYVQPQQRTNHCGVMAVNGFFQAQVIQPGDLIRAAMSREQDLQGVEDNPTINLENLLSERGGIESESMLHVMNQLLATRTKGASDSWTAYPEKVAAYMVSAQHGNLEAFVDNLKASDKESVDRMVCFSQSGEINHWFALVKSGDTWLRLDNDQCGLPENQCWPEQGRLCEVGQDKRVSNAQLKKQLNDWGVSEVICDETFAGTYSTALQNLPS